MIKRNGKKTFTHTLTVNQLVDLKKIYQHFSLKRVDEYVFENSPLLQLWSKKDIYTYRAHNWPVIKAGGFPGFKNQIILNGLLKKTTQKFLMLSIVMVKKLEKLGGATQAENDLDKDVLEVKALETKIGGLSKSTFKHNFFMYI